VKLAATALIGFAAAAAAAPPKLDMTSFFAGKSHSENVIKIAFHAPHKLVVDSVGGRNKEGDFVLVDTVREEGKPVRTRTWVMRRLNDGHFTGFLSDAKGPVDAIVSGDTATIRYTMKDGNLKIVEQIQAQGDGKTLANHAVAKKFGIAFAHVDGTIRKLD
jgi:hypothetical protein